MTKQDYYKNLYEWYEDKAEPEMKKLDQIFTREIKDGRTNEFIFQWWGEFRKNVMFLFEAARYKNPSYQLAMTMRWLMETAASVAFIEKYPENILELEKWFFDIYNIKPQPTRYEIADRAGGQSLYRYENGKKNSQPTGQKGRIKDAFTDEERKHYRFLNMFAHFDLTGIVWDLKVHCSTDQERYLEDLAIIHLLPRTIDIMVTSLAKIYDIAELKNFDFNVAVTSQPGV